MATVKEIHDAREELNKVKGEMREVMDWIKEHCSHPDFLKVIDKRNLLSVKIKTAEFKYNNLLNGEPILGEGLDIIELEKFHYNQIQK